jgi:dienelactone hydrolase
MLRWTKLLGLAVGWVMTASVAATLAADPPPTALLFTASDLAGLETGLRVPVAGDYTIKAWTSDRIDVKASRSDDTITLTVSPKSTSPAKPRWVTLGREPLTADGCTRLVVKNATDSDGPPPLPALLSLSTRPDWEATRALDLVRGALKTDGPTLDRRRVEIRTNEEGADFDPPATLEAWQGRARTLREQLRVTLGLWPMPERTPLHPRVVGTLEREGYAIDKVVLEPFPRFYLAGNLYRPADARGRLPVVLSPHGHYKEGRVHPDVQARCVRLARLGCVVFSYDMVGYADTRPFGHAFSNERLKLHGLSLPTLQTWNSLRALDWLLARPDVDPARVAITGESGGATQTFLITALDDRIQVAAPVVMVSDSFQGGCVCENAAGLRFGTDNVEIAALAAPRPLKLVAATGDWTARTLTNAFPSLQLVYARAGATDRLSADLFDFEHNYNQTSRDAVMTFLARWFLGIDPALAAREAAFKVETLEDLSAFPTDHPYPLDALTPDQLETDLIDRLARQREELAPGDSPTRWEAARDRLAVAHRVRVGLKNPAPRDTSARLVREVERSGLAIDHFVIGRKATGDAIPVVRLTPGEPTGRLTVVFSARGKSALCTADGEPSDIAQALLDRGQAVVGFDPLLVGESFDPAKPTRTRPSTTYFDTYNPSLPADRIQDLATVLSWARSLPDVHEVSLVATGPAGALALLARPSLEGLARVAIDLDGFDFGAGNDPIPTDLALPGVLQFGALPAAAALSAPHPLWLARPGKTFDPHWPTTAYALADSAAQLRLDGSAFDPKALALWIDAGE